MTLTKDCEILKTEVPEFFTDSWEDVKNNEKLLVVYLWQAVTAGGYKQSIDDDLEGARECASTLTASTIEECKQTVLRMVSKGATNA